MIMAGDDVFHKAARDGYLDLLREATRKECNKPDEDGRTPTMWAAYCGNLDALRMLVGRGGNPDKCDLYGNTALHHAAANGMMNCVTFLVSFGTNLWALDNDFHTALDIAALTNREEIVRYLDTVYTKQSALNPKLVKKWKEKAQLDAQKRTKKLNKMHEKLAKKAVKDDKKLMHSRERRMINGVPKAATAPPSLHSGTIRSTKSMSNYSMLSRKANSNFSDPKPYSEHFTITAQNRRAFIGGTARKVPRHKQNPNVKADGDFVVREVSYGKKTVRSLVGLRRDMQVLYMPTTINGSITSIDSGHGASNGDTPRSYKSAHYDGISRALSEPEFCYNGDSGVDLTSSQDLPDTASIFERPGFGSVAFMRRPVDTLRQISDDDTHKPQAYIANVDVHQNDVDTCLNNNHVSPRQPVLARKQRAQQRTSGKSMEDSLSIGTIGSLAVRIKGMNMQEEPVLLEDDLENEDEANMAAQNDLDFFLAANGLSEYFVFVNREKIDLDSMMLLTEDDLDKLGLPIGPKRKLIQAIAKRKLALDKPGILAETWL